MNSLTKSLVKDLLPESIGGKEVTALFGGGFKPPTSGHLEVIQKSLKNHPEIDNIIIYVGSKVRDGITQDQSFEVWDRHYKQLIDKPVRVEKSVSPIGDIYRYAKDNPEDSLYWIIGSREGREGTKMIFVLKPDFTYEIKHYMEDMMTDNPQEKKKVDVLNFIRKSEKPVCVADLANDPIGMWLSSGIRKRTLRYIFEFLEKNKLIQRVDTPVNVSSKGGRPPVYYVAPIVGKTIVPYTKRGKSTSKLNNVDIPMDLIDKENCQNPKIVKTSSVDSFDTNGVLPKQIVNETPSTGTNNSFATRSDVYKEDEDDKFWNTNNN